MAVNFKFWWHSFRSYSEYFNEDKQKSKTITRDLTATYMIALSIVAGLSILSHLLLDQILKQNISSSVIINVAGRQRMLSQRIGFYSQAFVNGDSSVKAPLEDMVDLMEHSHQALITGSSDPDITNKLSTASQRIYFQEPLALDRRTRHFLSHTRRLLETTDPIQQQAIYGQIESAAKTNLLPVLDQAVKEFELEAKTKILLLRKVQKLVLGILLLTLCLEAILIFRPLVVKIQHTTNRLLMMATRDELTGLFNRRYFIELSEREILLALRHQHPLTLLMIDIDHFKKVNDTFGHATGDEVIRKFASVARDSLRQTDLVGRIGGEEFAVVLINSNIKHSLAVAERLRSAIAEARIQSHRDLQWTISVGIAELSTETSQLSNLMKQADQALYAAKAQGRNRTVLASSCQEQGSAHSQADKSAINSEQAA